MWTRLIIIARRTAVTFTQAIDTRFPLNSGNPTSHVLLPRDEASKALAKRLLQGLRSEMIVRGSRLVPAEVRVHALFQSYLEQFAQK
jgi:hypothetical protein